MRALDALDPKGEGAGYEKVRQQADLSDRKMTQAVTRLLGLKLIEDITIRVGMPKGASKPARGLRRVNK
jgi:hypothetical protein